MGIILLAIGWEIHTLSQAYHTVQYATDATLTRQKRIEGLYAKDEKQTIRCSADNPNVKTIYQEFLGKPLGPLSHELLHTSYGRVGNC